MFRRWKWPGVGLMTLLVLGAALAVPSSKASAGKPGPQPARTIAFYQLKSGGPSTTTIIGTMDASGGNVFTVLQDKTIQAARAWWSPDGTWLGGYKKLIWDGLGWDEPLFRIRPDGTGEREVVRYADVDAYNVLAGKKSVVHKIAVASIGNSAWGPPGTMLFEADVVYTWVYTNQETGAEEVYDDVRSRIYMVNVETRQIFQVTDEKGSYDDFYPYYSQALNKIVFASNRMGPPELFAVNPDGTGLQQLTQSGADFIAPPVVNRAGTALAVSYRLPGQTGYDVWIQPVLKNPQDGTLQVAGGFPVRKDPNKSEEAVAWSPDDSRLLINRNWRTGTTTWFQIVSINIASNQETILKEVKGTSTAGSDWSPVSP